MRRGRLMAEATGAHVEGHALIEDGAPHNDRGVATVSKFGRGKCECGALSPAGGTIIGRKRWHRKHKQELPGDAVDGD
jgi:hypothetical protein